MSTKGTHIPDWLAVPFAGITPAPTQEKGQDLFPTGNWRAIRPVYRDKLPPCNNMAVRNRVVRSFIVRPVSVDGQSASMACWTQNVYRFGCLQSGTEVLELTL